jgi:hypothetical protein
MFGLIMQRIGWTVMSMKKRYARWGVLVVVLGACMGESWSAEPPAILSFSPQSGPPGTRIAIQGVNLDEIQSIQLNGKAAEFGILTEGTDLYMVVPLDATSGFITIATAHGQTVSEQPFTVVLPGSPGIESFSPGVGEAGTAVILKGTNFISVVAVRFNGLDAIFSSGDSSTILATVPKLASSGPITVVTAYGSATSGESFSVAEAAAPTISGFSPSSGSEGSVVLLEGTALSRVNLVRFGGVSSSFFVLSAYQIRALVPIGAKTGPITVESDAGSFSTSDNFTVTASMVPVIDTMIPMEGRPGTSVLILGTNLHQTKAVKFNGVAANFTTFTPGVINATVPEGATTGPITVETMMGTGSSQVDFKVIVAGQPSITEFTPSSGSIGTVVRITGSNLVNVLEVAFNGTPALFSTNAGLQAEVPATATSGPISVRTMDGQAVSREWFTVPIGVDLQISQTAIAARMPDAWQVTLAMSITNTGTAPASAVLVSNLFERGSDGSQVIWPDHGISNLTYKVLNVSQGEFKQGEDGARWEIGDLPAGGFANMTVLVEGTGAGRVSIWARVSSAETDAKPTDNLAVTSLQVGSLPRLKLARGQDKTIILSWPSGDPGWLLQSAPGLPASPEDWVSVEPAPVEADGEYRVTVSAVTGRQFYRLVRP